MADRLTPGARVELPDGRQGRLAALEPLESDWLAHVVLDDPRRAVVWTGLARFCKLAYEQLEMFGED